MVDGKGHFLPCMFCAGTYKCSYCYGKGERRSFFLKRMKKCTRCNGTGACPFCLGDDDSWAKHKLPKSIPEYLKEDYIEMRRKEYELKERYESLRRKGIDVMSIEAFMDGEQYKKEIQKIRLRDLPRILEIAIKTAITAVEDYEVYLDNLEQEK